MNEVYEMIVLETTLT